jgi:hypothetical protein
MEMVLESIRHMPDIELLLKSEPPRRVEVITGAGGSIADPRQARPLANRGAEITTMEHRDRPILVA